MKKEKHNKLPKKDLQEIYEPLPSSIKKVIYIGAAIGVVWASKYLFKIFAGTIRAFKELRSTIKEK